MPPVNFPFAQPIVPATAKRFTDDFKYIAGSVFANRWGTQVSGGGTVAVTGDASTNTYGRTTLSTGGGAAAIAGVHSGLVPFPANNLMLFQCNATLATLSDGANRYTIFAGLFDRANPNIGFCFQYSDNINGGKWRVLNNGAAAIDTSIFASVTRNAFRMYAAAPTGPIVCLINDQLVGAIQAAVQTFDLSLCVQIQKSVGIAARTCIVDYAGLYWMRPDVSV